MPSEPGTPRPCRPNPSRAAPSAARAPSTRCGRARARAAPCPRPHAGAAGRPAAQALAVRRRLHAGGDAVRRRRARRRRAAALVGRRPARRAALRADDAAARRSAVVARARAGAVRDVSIELELGPWRACAGRGCVTARALIHLDRQASAGSRTRARSGRRRSTLRSTASTASSTTRPGTTRDTSWRWSAGVGRSAEGRSVGWNLVEGVHDASVDSERTVWLDGLAREVEPQPFALDLSAVGGLTFSCARTSRELGEGLLVSGLGCGQEGGGPGSG